MPFRWIGRLRNLLDEIRSRRDKRSMSAPLPIPDGCCAPACADEVLVQVPGPPGDDGADGTNGTDGINAFTTTSANFTMPAVSGSVAVEVVDSSWAANGQTVYVSTAGSFTVTGIPDSTHLTLTNLGYTGNAAPATTIFSPQQVSPGGLQGETGSSPSSTLNDLSPTTTKGDILVDNGANSPDASLVRLAVGTDGKSLVADSSQATGLNYATITPNTAVADNNVPRFNGTSGTPMPLQDSFVNITDTGAIRASGSGGNARGTSAVDLQVSRTNVANVASGTNSFIGGGIDNKASGIGSVAAGGSGNAATGNVSGIAAGSGNAATSTSAFVGGGDSNVASGSASSVVAGTTNTASAQNSSVGGGSTNIASGVASHVGGGNLNTASAASSTIPGGIQGVSNKYGQISHASGAFATAGDAQYSELLWRISTTDATPTEAFLDGSSVRGTIGIDSTWGGKIIVVGRSSAGVCAVWEVEFGIQNNANTVSMVAAASVAVISDGTGTTWGVAGGVAVTADNTNKSLKIEVTGAMATNIRWLAHARFCQVGY